MGHDFTDGRNMVIICTFSCYKKYHLIEFTCLSKFEPILVSRMFSYFLYKFHLLFSTFLLNKLIHFSLIFYDVVPESSNVIITQHSENVIPYRKDRSSSSITFAGMEDKHDIKIPSTENTVKGNVKHRTLIPSPSHPLIQPSTVVRDYCENFAFPPPPPTDRKRYGPRRKSLLFSLFFQ